jgi:hypothetical protein
MMKRGSQNLIALNGILSGREKHQMKFVELGVITSGEGHEPKEGFWLQAQPPYWRNGTTEQPFALLSPHQIYTLTDI